MVPMEYCATKPHSVNGDTAVASQADRDRYRDRLAGFRIEASDLLPGATHCAVPLDCVGAKLREVSDAGYNLLAVGVPNRSCA